MELSSAEWAKAEAIASELAQDVDRNELGKIVAYAQRTQDTGRVLKLVERLPQSGYVRSGRTRGYLQRIAGVLRRELAGLEGERALAVLAWSFRLLTTYQTERGTRTADGRKKPGR
jgi:hypothetical protein